jgi:hypothetical protein
MIDQSSCSAEPEKRLFSRAEKLMIAATPRILMTTDVEVVQLKS